MFRLHPVPHAFAHSRRPVEVVGSYVFAGPHQLHRPSMWLRNLRNLCWKVVLEPTSEATAHQRRVHGHAALRQVRSLAITLRMASAACDGAHTSHFLRGDVR